MSLLKRAKTSAEGMWSATTTVRRMREATDFSTWLSTSIAMAESRPVVGSSRSTILGLAIKPRPMPTRFFSPPEIPRTVSDPRRTSRHLVSPSIIISSSTRSARCSSEVLPPRRKRAMYISVSRTVKFEMQLKRSSRVINDTRWR
mmetsp:Transcript_2044/g.4349  ORF Transcript_2044/g.4349 Transcript_2044/m.4349 type:complete len:145 (-) Transcript_2044:366-800(-)